MSYHSPAAAVHAATPEPQRAVERPASPHAARRRQTRDDNAPYTFGTCGNGRLERSGTTDEIVSLLEAGLGLGRDSGEAGACGTDPASGTGPSSASSVSDRDFDDEDVEEGDDELSVEDDQDDDWTPPHPSKSDSTQNSPSNPNKSTTHSTPRPPSSTLIGLRSQSTREPDRHSHAARDAGAAAQALAVATRAVKSATTLVTQDKARANWIQLWLSRSYELHNSGNVSRTALYTRYVRTCEQYAVKPNNAASFGKAIKQQWPTIKTRRLGVRGNSRYHYVGLRPAHAQEADDLHLVDLEEAANPASASITTIRTPRQPPARSRSNSLASTASSLASAVPAVVAVKEEPDSGQEGLLSVMPPMESPEGERMVVEMSGDGSGAAGQGGGGGSGGEGLPQTPTTARPSRAALVGWSNQVSRASSGESVNSRQSGVNPLETAAVKNQEPKGQMSDSSAGSGSGFVPRDGDNLERLHSRRNASASLSISVPPASTPSHSSIYGTASVRVASPAQMSQHQSHSSVGSEGAFFATEPVAPASAPLPTTAMPRLTRLPIDGFPLGIEEAFEQGREYKWPEKLELAARELWWSFVGHCRTVGLAMRAGRFDEVGLLIQQWWKSLAPVHIPLIQLPAISLLIHRSEVALYTDILGALHGQILTDLAPATFAALTRLAQSAEAIQASAVDHFPPGPFTKPKVELGARFGHLLSRHVGLCQISQALKGVVGHADNLRAMAIAWDGIDFAAIKNQAALVCNCQPDLLEQGFHDFGLLLWSGSPNAAELILQFANATFERALQTQTSPRSLLVRWSFVSSQVLRDLTLRSVPSFGSFHIVSLFLDEYLAFQVLKRTALHSLAVSASVDAPVVPPPAPVPVATELPPPTLAQPPAPVPAPRSSFSSEGSAYLRRGSEASNASFHSFIFPSGPAQAEFARLTAEGPVVAPGLPAMPPPAPGLQPVADGGMGGVGMDGEPTPGLRLQMGGGGGGGQHRRMGQAFVDSPEGVGYAEGLGAVRQDIQQHQRTGLPVLPTFPLQAGPFMAPAPVAPSALLPGLMAAHSQPPPPSWPVATGGSGGMYADAPAALESGGGAVGSLAGGFGGVQVAAERLGGPMGGYGVADGGEGVMMAVSSPRFGGMMGCFGELQ